MRLDRAGNVDLLLLAERQIEPCRRPLGGAHGWPTATAMKRTNPARMAGQANSALAARSARGCGGFPTRLSGVPRKQCHIGPVARVTTEIPYVRRSDLRHGSLTELPSERLVVALPLPALPFSGEVTTGPEYWPGNRRFAPFSRVDPDRKFRVSGGCQRITLCRRCRGADGDSGTTRAVGAAPSASRPIAEAARRAQACRVVTFPGIVRPPGQRGRSALVATRQARRSTGRRQPDEGRRNASPQRD